MLDIEYAWKKKLSIKKFQKMLKEYRNIIWYLQIWIWGDIDFNGCACQDYWWWTLFLFPLFLIFYFSFSFSFIFLFLEQLGLGFISHTVTSVTNWWCSHETDHGTWKNEVEESGTKWHHTAWTTHAGLRLYSWSFRVGCPVASMDHG